MQFISQMLTEDGQIIRRERSYEGVEWKTKTVDLKGRDRQMSDNLTGSLENVIIMSNQIKEVAEGIKDVLSEATNTVKNYAPSDVQVKKDNLATANFGSKVHEIVNQFLLSMKAKSVVDVAIEKITATEGNPKEKTVIAVQNTMESIIDSLEEQGLPLNFNGLTELYLVAFLRTESNDAEAFETVLRECQK